MKITDKRQDAKLSDIIPFEDWLKNIEPKTFNEIRKAVGLEPIIKV